jgi:hypothetical protein
VQALKSSYEGILSADAELYSVTLSMSMRGCCTITQRESAAALSQLPTASGFCLYASYTGTRADQQNTGIK